MKFSIVQTFAESMDEAFIDVSNALAHGFVNMKIDKKGPFSDHYKSNIDVKLYLGKKLTGMSSFKKCQVTGKPKTKKYTDPFSPYDFQALSVVKSFDLSLEINEKNLFILSGTLPTANMSNPEVNCIFDNTSDFSLTSPIDYRKKSKADILSNDNSRQPMWVFTSKFVEPPFKVYSISSIDGKTPFKQDLNETTSHVDALELQGLITFDGLEQRSKIASSTHCEVTTQKTPTSIETKQDVHVSFSVNFAENITTLSFNRIPIHATHESYRVSVSCPELIPISHNPDNTTYTCVNYSKTGRHAKYYNSVAAPTFSPSSDAPIHRLKPPVRHDVASLVYAVTLIPQLSRVQIEFEFSKDHATTIWDKTTVDLVLGNNPTDVPAGTKASCELTAQTQTQIDIFSVETKQASTYFKTFTLDYVLDRATKLLRLQGTMPTFGMKNPKINCYVFNDSDFAMDKWTFKDNRSKNKVFVGEIAVPADATQPAFPLRNNFDSISFDTMDGTTPLSMTLTNVIGELNTIRIFFPELITFKEFGTVMKQSQYIKCQIATRKHNQAAVIETSRQPYLVIDVIQGSLLVVRDISSSSASEIKITCNSLTPVSHYYQNQFYIYTDRYSQKHQDHLLTHFLVLADTLTMPPEKSDPVGPPKYVDLEDSDDSAPSSLLLQTSLVIAVSLTLLWLSLLKK